MTNLFKYFVLLLFLVGLNSCEDELALPDNIAEFESSQLGFSADEAELTVNINFSRAVDADGSIELTAMLTNLEYETQFTTEPALSSGKIVILVATGATSVSLKVLKSESAILTGDEQIKFTISSSVEGLVLGEKTELTVSFAEIIATLGSINPSVGGDSQPNKVFIDLSANRQSFVSRSDWDLGFYTENGVFRVVLNTSTGMLARALVKSDLNTVSATDTTGFGGQFSLAAIFAAIMGPPPSWIPEAITWADDPAGDINATAIAEVASADADNKVYIINRGKNADGSERGWKKIRVIRNGSSYTLQHADIAATTFQSLQISKDEDFLFNYVKFETGLVTVEPKKDQWDIAFTVFTNSTPTGPPGSPIIPFEFRDFVIQNRNMVETAQVMTSVVTYENFVETNLSGLTFSTSQKGIGSSWRTIPSNSTTPPSVNSDRFYVIKDPVGNIYKMRFTALTKSGERGNPSIEFKLVKVAS